MKRKSAVGMLGAIDAAWEPQIQTLGAEPISVKFVAQGAIAFRGGRGFVMFKRPGQAVNTLHEILWGPPIALKVIGTTPITDYKDGDCDLDFDGDELVAFNTCSPNPATGGDATAVLWRTGIMVAELGGTGGTVDTTARAQIAALTARVNKHLLP
jgi:hypothetical protein